MNIKSHAKCALTKRPLTPAEYLDLPLTFGLTEDQRLVCYKLYEKYEKWRENESYWDEMDRTLYILEHGPSVYREEEMISWSNRVNKRGEIDLLDDEGKPLYPFFFKRVFVDEAQVRPSYVLTFEGWMLLLTINLYFVNLLRIILSRILLCSLE